LTNEDNSTSDSSVAINPTESAAVQLAEEGFQVVTTPAATSKAPLLEGEVVFDQDRSAYPKPVICP
jgi:hypothetical protein